MAEPAAAKAAAASPSAPGAPGSLPRFRPRGRIVKAPELAAWQTGQDFLAAAERQQRQMAEDLQRAHQAARAAGYADGRVEGAAAAARLLAATAAAADRQRAAAAGELAELALAVVERLLGSWDDAELIARLAREALAEQRAERPLILRVAPTQADPVRHRLAPLLGAEDAALVLVEPDPAVGEGDAVLASAIGFVELGLAAQLDALRAGLQHALREPA